MYTIVRTAEIMNIVVVSMREDSESYKLASKRKEKYGKSIFEDIFK